MGDARDILATLIERVEDDRREPDKLLCHLQTARRALADADANHVTIPMDSDHRYATFHMGYDASQDYALARFTGLVTNFEYEWHGGDTITIHLGLGETDVFSQDGATLVSVWDSINRRERCFNGEHDAKDGVCTYCGEPVE